MKQGCVCSFAQDTCPSVLYIKFHLLAARVLRAHVRVQTTRLPSVAMTSAVEARPATPYIGITGTAMEAAYSEMKKVDGIIVIQLPGTSSIPLD